jgi:hypothetical protein
METISELHKLKKFGHRKQLPKKYEKEILIALSHYPELRNVHITVALVNQASVPYGTKPDIRCCLHLKSKRSYTIAILEEADYPESAALFKNLTECMRTAVIAHELFHVVQYHFGSFSLIRTLSRFLIHSTRRKLERAADKGAIFHGCGQGLLEHAIYLRTIPGYVKKRPAIETDYLKPAEIRYLLDSSDKLQDRSGSCTLQLETD